MSFLTKIKNKFLFYFNKKPVQDNEEIINRAEMVLLGTGIGIVETSTILNKIKGQKKFSKDLFLSAIKERVDEITHKISSKPHIVHDKLNVIFIYGANGVGKTTSAAKIALRYSEDYNVYISSCDTFRDAAILQLRDKIVHDKCKFIDTSDINSPSAAAYTAIDFVMNAPSTNNPTVLILDSAGRMSVNESLMHELNKINKVINKFDVNVINILTLDSNFGNDIIRQINNFTDMVKIDGVLITKIDSGVVFASSIRHCFDLNQKIYFLGYGENNVDLSVFDKDVLQERFVNYIYNNF